MVTEILKKALSEALSSMGVEPPVDIHLERPARREHGDWSSSVALATAKNAGKNPRELGTALVEYLDANRPEYVLGVAVAGPGFVNFTLDDSWLHHVLAEVASAGVDKFARLDTGGGQAINVEFISANPNKPLHAGHARGACYGDSVARLLDRVGYEVTREFYLNDRGVQMNLFAESLAARKRGEEPPEGGYQGAYITEWAAEMPDDADPLEWGYARALASHKETLSRVGIEFDVWFSERSMVASGVIDETLAELAEKEVSFVDDGATWLRSTDYGDDKDRVLVKSDGELTYLAPDIAYHRDKFSRFPKLINIFGADHHGYVVRMKAAMQALGHDPEDLEIRITQLVDLERGGETVRMSGRAGDFVSFDDIIDEVGPDVTRLMYLMQSVDTRQTIDLDAVSNQAADNPVFYVQYANARIHSAIRNAAEKGHPRKPLADVDLSVLVHERELELLRAISTLPETVEHAANERSPHTIAGWSRDLAAAFHGFYHDCYVVGDDVSAELTQARLWLLEATLIALAVCFDLLGVSAPESM